MPSCVACGSELEPLVRAPHTVYVKSLYELTGQTYCRHHIIRAATAAGVITEIRAGVGPLVALTRGVSSDERPPVPRQSFLPVGGNQSGIGMPTAGSCGFFDPI